MANTLLIKFIGQIFNAQKHFIATFNDFDSLKCAQMPNLDCSYRVKAFRKDQMKQGGVLPSPVTGGAQNMLMKTNIVGFKTVSKESELSNPRYR